MCVMDSNSSSQNMHGLSMYVIIFNSHWSNRLLICSHATYKASKYFVNTSAVCWHGREKCLFLEECKIAAHVSAKIMKDSFTSTNVLNKPTCFHCIFITASRMSLIQGRKQCLIVIKDWIDYTSATLLHREVCGNVFQGKVRLLVEE